MNNSKIKETQFVSFLQNHVATIKIGTTALCLNIRIWIELIIIKQYDFNVSVHTADAQKLKFVLFKCHHYSYVYAYVRCV